MKSYNTSCEALIKLFEDIPHSLFKYDTDNNLIYIDNNERQNIKMHSGLFAELQEITDHLSTLNCNYSIDDKGDILLDCSSKEYQCKIKSIAI